MDASAPSRENGDAADESSSTQAKVFYDSDEKPPNEETNDDWLHWRMDPSQSLSDWTLIIESASCTSQEGEKTCSRTERFHVHKTVLSLGPRKSDYFAALFKNGNSFSESKGSTSTIVLHELAAEAVPQLLDYLYSKDGILDVTMNNATALYHLAKYFQMGRLRWKVKQFWKNDLNAVTCGTYFRHARLLNDDKILNAVTEVCAAKVLSITKESDLFKVSDSRLWMNVIERACNSDKAHDASLHLSILVAEHCSLWKDDIEFDMFKELTDVKFFPEVHCDAACKLLNIERHLLSGTNSPELSCLQKRCIRALSKSWETNNMVKDNAFAILSEQSPAVLSKLLADSISAAREEMCDVKKKAEAAKKLAEDHCQRQYNWSRYNGDDYDYDDYHRCSRY